MIGQNEINVQGEGGGGGSLANQNKNCAVLYKHRTGKISKQIK